MRLLANHTPELHPVVPDSDGVYLTSLVHLYQGLLAASKPTIANNTPIVSHIITSTDAQLDLGNDQVLYAGEVLAKTPQVSTYASRFHTPTIIWPKGYGFSSWVSWHTTNYPPTRDFVSPSRHKDVGLIIKKTYPQGMPVEVAQVNVINFGVAPLVYFTSRNFYGARDYIGTGRLTIAFNYNNATRYIAYPLENPIYPASATNIEYIITDHNTNYAPPTLFLRGTDISSLGMRLWHLVNAMGISTT